MQGLRGSAVIRSALSRTFRRRVEALARLRAALALAVDAQLRAEAVLAHARAHREVIERHFERWRTERRKIAERREDG